MQRGIDTSVNTEEIIQVVAVLNNKTGIRSSVIYGKLSSSSKLWLHSFMQKEIEEIKEHYPDSKYAPGIRYHFETLREYIKE